MENLIKNIKANPLSWLIQVASIIAIIIALYVTARIAPLVEDINSLSIRVQATEDVLVSPSEFAVLKDNVSRIDKNVEKIADKLGVITK